MKIIAIEEHFYTPMQKELTKKNEFRHFYLSSRSEQLGHDIERQGLDAGEERIAYMDEAGIDVQVLSFGSPGAQAFPPQTAIPMARDANDRMFAAMQDYPGRFEAFAALPTAAPEAAADELERTVLEYGFKGTMIHGHTQGAFLDEKAYWPILARAEALDVPIYLHPTYPHPDVVNAYFSGYEELARAGWGFQMDTLTHFLRILFSGAFDEFPKLKFILGHLGEGLPFMMHRLNDHTHRAAARRGLKKSPLEYIHANLLVTTSGNWFEPSLQCTLAALGVEKVLFAVDWPYEPNKTGVDFLNQAQLSETDRELIAHGNAERELRM